jgi:peptidoglycan hydrolase-like protein with peptidoglycan-binding domain
VVTAVDITHDPNGGMDAGHLAEFLRRAALDGEYRVKYIIWNRRIASRIQNWIWRPYSGTNPHTSHVHLSVSETEYDHFHTWGYFPGGEEEEEVISRGNTGNSRDGRVELWQRRLNTTERARNLTADGLFGPQTEEAVKEFQRSMNLPATGVIDLTTAVQIQAMAHGKANH